MSKSRLTRVVFSSNSHVVCYAFQTCLLIQSISPVFSMQNTTQCHKNESMILNRSMYDHDGIAVTVVLGQKIGGSNLNLRIVSRVVTSLGQVLLLRRGHHPLKNWPARVGPRSRHV